MTQAVEDGATRPVYYESRVIHLKLDENTLHLIDNEYDIMADNADPYVIEKSKKELGQMEAILGADQTINSLVNDILDHYENYRENILTGKAMIVAYSRPIAMKIYKRILELRPAWTEKIAVVMTQGNNDPEEWREIIGNKAHKDDMARKFKDNNSPLKIAIVVDMWLTGFDVPSLATMYVYKPMAGHNLMQAIARVNRVFKDKEGGLVVDYVGIAAALKQAMNDYLNGMLTNEEVIQELLKLAKDIAAAAAEGEKLGLTADELAFYDALTKPQAIKDFYEHDELIAITKELTDLLRKNRTIDWQKKESARAGMRRLVKRLLKKHKYPPDGMDDAVQTVMSQCEMWVDNT